MTDHLTTLCRYVDQVGAHCPEHGGIGRAQPPSRHGFNAVITEARGHDDVVHGVYRTEQGYRAALVGEARELRAS